MIRTGRLRHTKTHQAVVVACKEREAASALVGKNAWLAPWIQRLESGTVLKLASTPGCVMFLENGSQFAVVRHHTELDLKDDSHER